METIASTRMTARWSQQSLPGIRWQPVYVLLLNQLSARQCQYHGTAPAHCTLHVHCATV